MVSPVRIRVPPLPGIRGGLDSCVAYIAGAPRSLCERSRIRCVLVEEKSVKMRSGCFGLLMELGAWVLSTILTTVGVLMLLVGALTFGPSIEPLGVLLIVAAPIGALVLIKVGRDIMSDLRRPK